jgi:putative membrane protein
MMLLVLCVDLDDDLGRKTGHQTPVVGRKSVEEAAVDLATADPEDSDVNVLFEGVHLYDHIDDETVEVAVVTGTNGSDVTANRLVGEEIDTVLASLSTGEDVHAVVITDGAQDESVIPVIRSRVPIDSVRRVVVRQAQDLESMYYTIKQVLDDPETRGTILVPLGVLLLIYPLVMVANYYHLPGVALGVLSGLLGGYLLFHGLGLDRTLDAAVERTRTSLYTGRVTLVTYVVATALIVIGGVSGVEMLSTLRSSATLFSPVKTVAALVYGAIQWFAIAGITASLGRVTDEYLHDTFRWRYLNAPFYVLSIAAVLYSVSAYVLSRQFADLSYLAIILTASTLLGVFSTLAFAIAESRSSQETKTPV